MVRHFFIGLLLSLMAVLTATPCFAEKYRIPPEYGPKKAVLISVHCLQLQHDHAEEYLIKTIAYSLTRSDVYLEMCDSLSMHGIQKIDLENIDEDQFRINQQKLDSSHEYSKDLIEETPEKTKDFFEDILEVHKNAQATIQGRTHQLFMYNNPRFNGDNQNTNVYIRDRSVLPVQRANGARYFMNTANIPLDGMVYLNHFLAKSEIIQIPRLPIYMQPSSFVMDQQNIFISSSYVSSDKIRNDQTLMNEYFDFKNLVFLETNINESTAHIDTLIKFVKNPLNNNVEVLLATTQPKLSTGNADGNQHSLEVMKWEVESYHSNKNRDRKNKKTLNELGYIVHEIPNSGIYGNSKDRQFTANYVNSLILGDVVLVPQYVADYMYGPKDLVRIQQDHQNAVKIYQKFFKYVVSIPVEHQVRSASGGAVHCLTSDIPQ